MYFENHNGIVPSFSAFADTIPEPIYWLDLNHRMVGVNELAAGARSEKDLIGKTALDIYPEKIAKQ